MPGKKKYLLEKPRGFANEFSIYAVSPEQMSQAEKIIQSYQGNINGTAYWITRRKAESLTAQNRKEARNRNIFQNPVGATEILPLEEREG